MRKDEIFKPMKNYEGIYEISNYGVMRNINTGKEFCGSIDTHGYIVTTLRKNGKKKTEKVHRLVALTFLENPEGATCVNHKDEDKTNNYYLNLE